MEKPSKWKAWNFLHGKGHDYYDSKEAKEAFAKQLISLSEKTFWVLIAPFLGYFLDPSKVDLLGVAISSTAMLLIGLYFRHQGLQIIDDIKTEKIKIELSGNFTR